MVVSLVRFDVGLVVCKSPATGRAMGRSPGHFPGPRLLTFLVRSLCFRPEKHRSMVPGNA